jgi:uncharacterized membrane protein YtjA (UPF0391 family)
VRERSQGFATFAHQLSREATKENARRFQTVSGKKLRRPGRPPPRPTGIPQRVADTAGTSPGRRWIRLSGDSLEERQQSQNRPSGTTTTPQAGEQASARETTRHEENPMLYYAIVFLIIALVAGFFGFFGVAGLAAGIAKILFVIFIILFIVSLIFGRRRRL